jgi:hypothetical protein
MFRFRHVSLRLVLAAVCTEALPALAQDHASHAAHASHAQPATPVAGVRYATDAPLRQGMADIRVAVGLLGHHEHGHLDDAQVRRLAGDIERAIGGIVASCKLDPQADAVLHGILGGLGEGIAALKEKPSDPAPVARLRAALDDYARRFDDPGAMPAAPVVPPAP